MIFNISIFKSASVVPTLLLSNKFAANRRDRGELHVPICAYNTVQMFIVISQNADETRGGRMAARRQKGARRTYIFDLRVFFFFFFFLRAERIEANWMASQATSFR